MVTTSPLWLLAGEVGEGDGLVVLLLGGVGDGLVVLLGVGVGVEAGVVKPVGSGVGLSVTVVVTGEASAGSLSLPKHPLREATSSTIRGARERAGFIVFIHQGEERGPGGWAGLPRDEGPRGGRALHQASTTIEPVIVIGWLLQR